VRVAGILTAQVAGIRAHEHLPITGLGSAFWTDQARPQIGDAGSPAELLDSLRGRQPNLMAASLAPDDQAGLQLVKVSDDGAGHGPQNENGT
jgi:hypothetical protein